MKQRLEQFLAAENLTKAQFADSINMARAGISHILAGRNNPSYEFIANTMSAYPNLNIEWLLGGGGKMYKNAQDSPDKSSAGTELFGHATQEISSLTSNNTTQIPVEQRVTSQQRTPINVSGTRRKTAVKIIIVYNDNSFEVLG